MNTPRPTILIVEDETYILKVLKTLLEADAYRVLLAKNAAAAEMAVASHMPDLILLDLGLPDQDGIVFLQELRRWSQVPVIVVSARNLEQDKILALDNGADDYIAKPFSAPELLARIRAMTRAAADACANYYAQNIIAALRSAYDALSQRDSITVVYQARRHSKPFTKRLCHLSE